MIPLSIQTLKASVPDLELISNSQCFPLYTYEKVEATPQGSLFESNTSTGYRQKENINDAILKVFRDTYGDTQIGKEDIFYYVYGILHSPDYRQRYANDLKKMLPRIPYVEDFWGFSKAGRELAHWHLHYETIDPYPLTELAAPLTTDAKTFYRVEKMRFAKKGQQVDKTTIIYNRYVTLTGIPLQAYDYVVNGKPAIEWVMDHYQVTVDKDSQIRNDPNDWSADPRYIIDLLKRVVRVSVETLQIVQQLPKFKLLSKKATAP